jgi:16S rRNA pseudouridine516 synthase
MERLDKIISATGKKSRREVKLLVKQGRILVDGVPASAAEMKVDPAVSEILLDGENIGYQRFTYIMLHKPAGVLSAVEDKRQKTVLDLLPEEL